MVPAPATAYALVLDVKLAMCGSDMTDPACAGIESPRRPSPNREAAASSRGGMRSELALSAPDAEGPTAMDLCVRVEAARRWPLVFDSAQGVEN